MDEINDTTKRFPRTLESAFGPGHRGGIWEEPTPMDKNDYWVIAASLAALVFLIFVVGK